MKKHVKVLLAVAAIGLAGCRAQEGAKVSTPGLPPQAIADIVVVELNSANNTIDALGNDIDQSGTGLTITAVSVDQTLPPMAGAVATTDGNTVTFTPPATFVGVVTLEYSIEDGTGAVSSGAIAVSVLPVAPPPVALPDAETVVQDSGATDFDVLANDIDLAGGGLTLTAFNVTTSLPPAAHTVAIVGDQIRFTPAAAFVGAVLVDYTIEDVNGATATGVLTVVVSPIAVPTGPVPVPDAQLMAQDSVATLIDVLANDIDPVGGGLTVSAPVVTASVPAATHTVAVSGNQVQFTPAPGFFGSVVVTYTATDADGNAADGVLTIVVTPLDLAIGPVPVPDAIVVAQDSGATLVDVVANDIDPAGAGLDVTGVVVTTSVPAATHTVAISGNQVQFTPQAGFFGSVVVTYTATDGDGDSADGVLVVTVLPEALAIGPVPVPDAATVLEDSSNNLITVLANDIDPAGGGLTLTGVNVTASVPTATHTLAISGSQVQFTPEAGFAGSVVVTYEATDSAGNSANGVLNVIVSPLTPPVGLVAIPDTAVIPQDSAGTDIDVLANDVDFAGGGLTVTAASVFSSLPTGTHSATVVGNQVRFIPDAAFAGVVVLQYTATDVNGATSNGLVNVTVTPAGLEVPPVALPDADTASSGAVVAQTFDVVANDIDPAAGGLTLTNVTVTSELPLPGSGAFAIVGNQIEYTPTLLYAGTVIVEYEVTDVNGNTSTSTLTLVVTP